LKTTVSNKQIIKMAAPISVALLIPQLSFFTNTVFLGKLGMRELGVNGITGVFYLILAMIGYGLSNGIQIQMARRIGERNTEALAQTFVNGVMLALFLALGLMIVSLWAAPVIFDYSLSDSTNFFMSVSFIYVRIWGLPFLMVTQLIGSFFIAIGKSRLLIYGSLAATVTNIVFDYLLIFGKGGFPALGFTGAAVASILGEVAYLAVAIILFFFHKYHQRYPFHRHLHFDYPLSKKTLTVAFPLIVQFIFSIGGWLVFFIFVEHLGKQELAASQMLRNIFGVMGIGVWAFATTCNTLVSKTIGEGKNREVLSLIVKIGKLSLIYGVIVSSLLFIFAREFLSVYSWDAQLVRFAIPSLRVIVVATILMSVSTVAFNGVVGTGNTVVNLTIECTSVCTYLIYCYFIIHQWHAPLYVCWMSEFIYWSALILFSTIYLRSGKWRGKRI
jgi:multidrug resistance protein, MATE family